jgi:Regulator of chromosome condensation (RCC1) repeat
VDKDFTAANTPSIYGSIPVLDANGNELTQSPVAGDAIYILTSSGMNGNGAWAKAGGTQKACDTTLKDGENCDGDIGVIDTSLQDGSASGANTFDDIVVWKVRESSDHVVIVIPSVAVAVAPSFTYVSSLITNNNATCIIDSTKALKCSGENVMPFTPSVRGFLGTGDAISRVSFTQEGNGFSDWEKLDGLGRNGGCAVRSGGRGYCWGHSPFGSLGRGSAAHSLLPVEIAGINTGWQVVNSGQNNRCGIKLGRAYCWGSNNYGGLGDGTVTYTNAPVQVFGALTGWQDISAEFHTGCGVRLGRGYCWGANNAGQWGNGVKNTLPAASTTATTPTEINPLGPYTDWEQVRVGAYSVCGIRAGGRLYCWGTNWAGQLGDGTTAERLVPTEVQGGLYTDWKMVETDGNSACAIRSTGLAYCWG